MKPWLQDCLGLGLIPYVAASEFYCAHLDFSIFEGHHRLMLLERAEDGPFHEAYLLSNSIAFGNPELKMPNWVYMDCVLMQSAVVGFALPKEEVPESLLAFYNSDPKIDVDSLELIPVSGQIAGLGIDGETLIGFSLFSLRRHLADLKLPSFAKHTKAAALHVYNAERYERFVGIAQYDNLALRVHARFGRKTYIDRPTMPLHPLADLTLAYRMKIMLDDARIFGPEAPKDEPYDFLMRFDDRARKQDMHRRMLKGEQFVVRDPTQIVQDGIVYLPISAEQAS
jgi:hypothetical protein